MKIRSLGILTLLFFTPILSGCAQKTWIKNGATTQSFNDDKYACERDARQSGYFGGGLVGSLNMQDFYNRCMNSKGYILDNKEHAESELSKNKQSLSSALAIRKKCMGDIYNNIKYQPILTYLPNIQTGDFTMVQMSSTKKPSHQEGLLLTDYSIEQDNCRNNYLNTIAPMLSSNQKKTFETRLEEGDLNTSQLIRSEINYGEWSSRETQSNRKLKSNIN